MKKIEAVGEGIEISCLKCGGNPNQEQFYIIYVGFWLWQEQMNKNLKSRNLKSGFYFIYFSTDEPISI